MATYSTLAATSVAAAIESACLAELQALKPGNVGIDSEGHGMTARDFELSAHAIAGPLARAGASVGQRIYDAIVQTRHMVQTNTNLGIVLLTAPLAQAALSSRPGDLRERLRHTLAQLSVEDAVLAYRAIRLAQPGGLGRYDNQDIDTAPTVTLLEAMRLASGRDSIARAYCDQYEMVFSVALPRLAALTARGYSRSWAVTGCYLTLLAGTPDSLLVRKFGDRLAAYVSEQAAAHERSFEEGTAQEQLEPRLRAWDRALKVQGLNPGTTADFIVAALFASAIEARESQVPD